MIRSTRRVMAVALLICAGTSSASTSVLVEDAFDGSASVPPDAAKFEWGGEVAQNGAGQLAFSTWTANHSWLRSKTGAAPGLGQTLRLHMRAYAYAEPYVYGDFQPRGLRVGSDANNAVEFYSVYGTSVGLRMRKDGVESLAAYALPSGVDSMHDYEISVTTTSVCFQVDGVLAGTFTTHIPTGVLNVYVSTFDGYFGNVPVTLESLSLALTDSEVEGIPPSITAQPVSVTVNVASHVIFSAEATGTEPLACQWVNDAGDLVVATNLTLTLNNVQTNQAGSYMVVITNAYGSVTSSVAVLTVTRLAQTISFGALPSKRVDDAPFTLNATASSGLPLSYTSSNPRTASVSGDTVTIIGAGSATITASQAGDAMYLPASDVHQTLRVAGLAGTVVAWGNGPPVPAGLTNVTAIAPGERHTVALKSDGTVVVWGNFNYYNQTNAPAGLSGLTAIAAGDEYTVALTTRGTVLGWGRNDFGQATAPAGLSNVTAIAAGGNHNMALKSDGTVVGWGNNYYGQANVPAGLSNVTAITAGREDTFGLKSDGTVAAWGINDYGQTSVPAGLSNVTAIAAGVRHTVAVKSDGTVAAWGIHDSGQTTGTPTPYPWLATANPVRLNGVVLSNVMAVAAGIYHSVALKSNGTVVAWGGGGNAQTIIPVGLNGVIAVEACTWYTVALVDVVPPSITAQPTNVTVNVDSNATFSVTATGTAPVTYQWQKDGVGMSGATNVSLTLNHVQDSQAGSYMVVITNAYGCVTSSVAVLTVHWLAPTIGYGVQANQFGFTITGSSNLVVVVDTCTNLANPMWLPLQTNTLSSESLYFRDLQWSNHPSRFYRVRSP